MSRFLQILILGTLTFVSSCTSVKVYKSTEQTLLHAAKTCGKNFCSEIVVNETQGKVLVTDIYGSRVLPTLIEVAADCNPLKTRPVRSIHLKRVLKTNDSIELILRNGFWEFSPSSLEEGCRLMISISSKKMQEKFQYTVLPKTAI
jgi:hypothetical protein